MQVSQHGRRVETKQGHCQERETIKAKTGMIIDRPDNVAGGTTTTGT